MASEKFFPYLERRQNIVRQFYLILLVSDSAELKSDAGYAMTADFWFSVTRCAFCKKIVHSNRAIQYTLYLMPVRAVKESEFKKKKKKYRGHHKNGTDCNFKKVQLPSWQKS